MWFYENFCINLNLLNYSLALNGLAEFFYKYKCIPYTRLLFSYISIISLLKLALGEPSEVFLGDLGCYIYLLKLLFVYVILLWCVKALFCIALNMKGAKLDNDVDFFKILSANKFCIFYAEILLTFFFIRS